MDNGLVNSLATPVNNVQQGFDARQKADTASTQQHDNDMLKVFEYAGDGKVDEAKYYAQAKGLQVPPEVFSNGDFAKGLALSGKFYGDDPAAAQKFATAWIQNPQGDFLTRMSAAEAAAGKPVNKDDREYQNKIRFEQWKLDHHVSDKNTGFSLSPGQIRYDAQGRPIASAPKASGEYEAYAKAYNATLGGAGDSDEAQTAGMRAAENYRLFNQGGASPGLTGGAPAPAAPAFTPQPAPVAPAPTNWPQAQIPSGLPQGSVMIGTSNGKAVYQAPNGDKFIDDGNP